MDKIKNINFRNLLITLIVYLTIVIIFSTREKTTDVIFLLAWLTIILHKILSVFKVNVEKFRAFLSLNLTMLPLTFLYDNYQYNTKNEFISNVILVMIIIMIALPFYLKKQNK